MFRCLNTGIQNTVRSKSIFVCLDPQLWNLFVLGTAVPRMLRHYECSLAKNQDCPAWTSLTAVLL